jgi:hypothetical protein
MMKNSIACTSCNVDAALSGVKNSVLQLVTVALVCMPLYIMLHLNNLVRYKRRWLTISFVIHVCMPLYSKVVSLPVRIYGQLGIILTGHVIYNNVLWKSIRKCEEKGVFFIINRWPSS